MNEISRVLNTGYPKDVKSRTGNCSTGKTGQGQKCACLRKPSRKVETGRGGRPSPDQTTDFKKRKHESGGGTKKTFAEQGNCNSIAGTQSDRYHR